MELWAHQKKAIERAKDTTELALFWEPGTGKTRATIEILRSVYNSHKRGLRTLILAPLVVLGNWKQEFAKYSKVPQDKILVLNGPGAARAKAVAETDAYILVTNYEGMGLPAFYAALQTWAPEVLVCDEAHRCKTYNAKRTKAVMALSDTTKYRYILTGTPVLNSQLDLFSQFRILDKGATFGKNFFAYRAEYFWDKNAGMPKQAYFPDWVPRADTNDKLSQRIKHKVSVAKKSECLDLPPLVEKELPVELTPQQHRLYEEMKKDFVTYLGDKACVATMALTKALRLQQIVSGFLATEDGATVFEDTPREQALRETLSDLLAGGHKVIVWAVFKANYTTISRVCDGLGVKYAMLTGDIQDKDKQIYRFRNELDYPVMIAHPGAGGIGVNLIEAAYSIVYSRNFSLEFEEQSKARNYRGGSEMHRSITRIHLVAENTIDRLIFEALSKKQNMAEAIMTLRDKL